MQYEQPQAHLQLRHDQYQYQNQQEQQAGPSTMAHSLPPQANFHQAWPAPTPARKRPPSSGSEGERDGYEPQEEEFDDRAFFEDGSLGSTQRRKRIHLSALFDDGVPPLERQKQFTYASDLQNGHAGQGDGFDDGEMMRASRVDEESHDEGPLASYAFCPSTFGAKFKSMDIESVERERVTPPIFFRSRSATANLGGSSSEILRDSREDVDIDHDAPMAPFMMNTAHSFPDGLLLPQHHGFAPANPSPLSRSHTIGSSGGGSTGSPISQNSHGIVQGSAAAQERSHLEHVHYYQQQHPRSSMAVSINDDVDMGLSSAAMTGHHEHNEETMQIESGGEADMQDTNQHQHNHINYQQQQHQQDHGTDMASPASTGAGAGAGAGDSQMKHGTGRQTSRYTLGYRDDCELCRAKTPGHFTHILSAPSDS